MGGMTKPSTSLVNTPPPGNQNPGIAQSFSSMMSGSYYGGQGKGQQAGDTLSGLMAGKVPDVTGQVMPAYQAMVDASKRQTGIGEQNLLENFSQMGLRNSSSALNADVDYQAQVGKDFASILSNYILGTQGQVMGSQLGAAQTIFGPFSAAGMQTYPTAALATGASPLSTVGGIAGQGAESLIMMAALGLI